MKTVCGLGINDANYKIKTILNDKSVLCPFYRKWMDMLRRITDKEKFPSYIGCSVCDEWLKFSNFKNWMEKQDWQGKELDKDLLFKGNKIYSPKTCLFIDKSVNRFLVESMKTKGNLPTGVNFHKASGKYQAQCSEFAKNRKYLGIFNTPEEAFSVYWLHKQKLALELAEQQKDEVIKHAIMKYYEI